MRRLKILAQTLRTPQWWYKKNAAGAPWWRPILWPLSQLWIAAGSAKAKKATPYRSSLKVISVGNLTVGGSGKTPVTREILRLLPNAVGLSKGYGGTLDGPINIDTTIHTAAEVGDEAWMLAREFPFFVARGRAAGLRAIEATDARIAVVDDAHQNLTIAKDISIVVVDGDTSNGAWPFGDGGVVPYGPMREPLNEGLARADIIILWLPSEDESVDPELLAMFEGKPVFIARLTAVMKPAHVVAFAAIAKPWKFQDTLTRLGCEVIDFKAYPDHAPISEADLTILKAAAEEQSARLITTEKDWVKLPEHWKSTIDYLPIRARFDDEAAFKAALLR
ncbi:tetraacyldisaccharide 4'-kinase [Asticcacaulis machinosus]|uniref:Tetraacyldisaccharide 4'-kinase n=1 Tax=Asticcacaulis machinosus TaxID=2984211 RepID=A0ABT5HNL1_9CAUL|nr:tetraacyldisaccharide 4'-kinase [Asticcacaulis machinosus]MDC7677741.1 tetraacyldisaccharide 4'-kinase [Asticcacaulis machinosus]